MLVAEGDLIRSVWPGILAMGVWIALVRSALAGTYYVATTGNDSNAGAIGTPLATITKAMSLASAGDTIFVRGGTYNLAAAITISKTGTSSNPFNLSAYPGETPILDFAAESSGARGIVVNSDYWHIKGLTIQNAHDNGVNVSGSNNTLELLTVRQNQDSGVQISGSGSRVPSNNLVLNCDSYQNYDPSNHGENADGFVAKFRGLGTGNVFRGVRSWGNSDDGFDFWEAASGVTVENSWSFKNGINIWGDTAFAGDGNGIKLGHDSGTHVLKNMVIWSNPANGVDVNGNATGIELPADPIAHGVDVYNVTAYNNGSRNFQFDESYPHVLRNNASVNGGHADVMTAGVDSANNSWNGISTDAADFLSLDDSFATGPRLADGSLPVGNFLHLAPGSNLINAGVNVGIAYVGAAPDLGAFETPEPGGLAMFVLVGLSLRRSRR